MNSVKELTHLKEDLGKLGRSIEKEALDNGEKIIKNTQETFSDIIHKVKKEATPVIKSVQEKSQQINKFVKESSWASVGLAAAAGLLIGMIIGRKRG